MRTTIVADARVIWSSPFLCRARPSAGGVAAPSRPARL